MVEVSEPGPSLLKRTAVGASWVIGWRMATRVIGLISTLVLIRLLEPSDFGLVALGSTFAIAIDTLSELGVEDTLVREPKPTPALYATAFTLTLIRGGVTAALVAGLAVPAASFFGEPRLAHVLWALAVVSLVGAAENIGVTDFRRSSEFNKEFRLLLLPRLGALVVTIGMAVALRSYWALIAGMLAGRLMRTAFSYRMHPWRPSLSLEAWRYLFGYTTWSWAISLAALVRDRMDAFVLGRTLDAGSVGVYAIGEEIGTLPTIELVSPIGRSCFSSFAAARAAGLAVEQTYLRPAAFAAMLTMPAGVGLSLVADPLVRVVIGERWLQAVPVMQVFGVIGAVSVFGILATTLLSAFGMLRRQFAITFAAVAFRLALIIPLVKAVGITGAALGALVAVAVEHGLVMGTAFRWFGIGWGNLLRATWRLGVATGCMVAVLVGSGLGGVQVAGAQGEVVWRLVAACALGAVTYSGVLGLLWLLCGRPDGAEKDLVGILRSLLARFRR